MIKEAMLVIYLDIFLFYIIIKSIIFYKKYKINPVSFATETFKKALYWWVIVILFLIYGISIALNYFGIFSSIFSNLILDITGFIMLLIGFLILIIAHTQMGKSWRMGFDNKTKTKLIIDGIFRYSRNPVYLGLMTQGLAILFLIPNLITLILFILLFLDFSFIIKSEEKFLEKQFGKKYFNYKQNVRRFI